jgi:GR25 family glycosyltransferase involved in LPS biosynthesis
MLRKKKTVILRDDECYAQLMGGLGNQLFIIATAYAYCLRYRKKLYLSKVWEGIRDDRPSYWNTLLKSLNKYTIDKIPDKNVNIYNEPTFGYKQIPYFKNNIVLKGYFQSPLYFIEYEKEIKELLKIPREHFFDETTVAVHIRRGDYLKHPDIHYNQNITYYKNAQIRMEELLGFRPNYIYFSDDKDWVKENFKLNEKDIISNISKDYEEFSYMNQCHHFIIANSSFSWWSAWLSDNPDKIVIAPSKWFGPKGPSDYSSIYPMDWIQAPDFEDNNSINMSHPYWKDDLIFNPDMSYKRSFNGDDGILHINNGNIVCLWNNYNPEQNTNNSPHKIEELQELQWKYIQSRISPLNISNKKYNLFLINLEHRNDRRIEFLESIKEYPFNIYRFNAIKHTKSYIGCALSHLYLIEYAKRMNLPYIIIAEDDGILNVSPEKVSEVIETLINNLDKWNVFNGCPTFGSGTENDNNIIVSEGFNELLKVSNFGLCSTFNIHNKNIYDKLLNFDFKIPIDCHIEKMTLQHIYKNEMFSYQRASYSDIEKIDYDKVYEDYFRFSIDKINKHPISKREVIFPWPKVFIGILSCQKYEYRRKLQQLNTCPFEYMYFIGDPELTESRIDIKNKVVYLPCKDDYESLALKVYNMLKWIAKNREVDYVLKTDDDIQFNFSNLSEIFLRAHLLNIDYGGYVVQNKEEYSAYHSTRNDVKVKQEVKLPLIEFCPGGGYILSKKAIDVIVNNLLNEYNILEDISIAKCLYNKGILPVKLNIYKYACFW